MEIQADKNTTLLNNCPATSGYGIKEAASLLRMSEKTVRRLIDRGLLRKCMAFGRLRIPCKDVHGFLEGNSEATFTA